MRGCVDFGVQWTVGNMSSETILVRQLETFRLDAKPVYGPTVDVRKSAPSEMIRYIMYIYIHLHGISTTCKYHRWCRVCSPEPAIGTSIPM